MKKELDLIDISPKEGCFNYSPKSLELLSNLLLHELKSQDKLPYTNDKQNYELIQDFCIQSLTSRVNQRNGKPIRYSDISKANYQKIVDMVRKQDKVLAEKIDPIKNPQFYNMFLDLYRTVNRPKNLYPPKADNKRFSRSIKRLLENRDLMKRIAILAGISLTIVAGALVYDGKHVNIDEITEDMNGLNSNKKADEIAKLLPPQNRIVKNSPIQYLPSEDPQMVEANDNIKDLYEQEGAKGIVRRYYDLYYSSQERNLTESEINELYAISYIVPQAIPIAKTVEAAIDYCESHNNAPFEIENLDHVYTKTIVDAGEYHGYYVYSMNDGTEYVTHDTQNSIYDSNSTIKNILELYGELQNNPINSQDNINKLHKCTQDSLKDIFGNYVLSPSFFSQIFYSTDGEINKKPYSEKKAEGITNDKER